MKTKNALIMRKVMKKSYVNKVEQLIVMVGEVATNYENKLISEDVARFQMTSLLEEALLNKVIAPSGVKEITDLIENDKETYLYLKKKLS